MINKKKEIFFILTVVVLISFIGGIITEKIVQSINNPPAQTIQDLCLSCNKIYSNSPTYNIKKENLLFMGGIEQINSPMCIK